MIDAKVIANINAKIEAVERQLTSITASLTSVSTQITSIQNEIAAINKRLQIAVLAGAPPVKPLVLMIIALTLISSGAMAQSGLASFYGNENHQWRTASGEAYRPWAEATCASRTVPFGSYLFVKDLRTGRTVTCRVNDRGPFVRGRIIDLSLRAAQILGMKGVTQVEIEQMR